MCIKSKLRWANRISRWFFCHLFDSGMMRSTLSDLLFLHSVFFFTILFSSYIHQNTVCNAKAIFSNFFILLGIQSYLITLENKENLFILSWYKQFKFYFRVSINSVFVLQIIPTKQTNKNYLSLLSKCLSRLYELKKKIAASITLNRTN